MKWIFNFIIFIFLEFILINCSKQNKDSEQIRNNFVIELTNDYRFINVSNYNMDTLAYIRHYTYNSNTISISQFDNKNNKTQISIYYLNKLGIADSCLDSTFLNLKLANIQLTRFNYDDNGYFISNNLSIILINSDTIISKFNFTVSFSNENGSSYSGPYGYCYFSQSYTTFPNLVDINLFLGNFTGKNNAYLIDSKTSNCAGEDMTIDPSSKFEYKFNSDGLVQERIEYYTTSYKYNTPKPNPIRYIDRFEYNIK